MKTLRAIHVRSSARRGSSWPIEVETADGPFFLKLSGAGHGLSAIIAEVIVGEIAESIGLRVPSRALLTIDDDLESENRDPELLELFGASHGLNLGLATLAGARTVVAGDVASVNADEASRIVWLDWFVMNPDRTALNPNLMIRRGQLWLIDHGAALVFHHNWATVTESSPHQPWSAGRDHVLLPQATSLRDWDAILTESMRRDVIHAAVERVPDAFIRPLVDSTAAVARRRAAYVAFLWKRLRSPMRAAA